MASEEDPRRDPLEERREERGRLPGDRRVRIVRPHRRSFRYMGPGMYEATEDVLRAHSAIGRVYEGVRRVLIGRRLPSEAVVSERVSKKTGLAIFASDNISSSAYATEEAMRVLVLAGMAGLALTMPITIAILVILVIVVLSYLQAVRAYPNGGGSYIVARENLGMFAGLIAAAALLVDYVLTVSVSVASGVAALGAAWPAIYDNRVLVGVAVIALVTVGNLRGIRESGNIFAAPTYAYVVSIGAVLLYGVFRLATGTLPQLPVPDGWLPAVAEPVALILVLRAFASGASGLTGVEAVSNGVPAFKPPEQRNASVTLVLMAVLFGSLFLLVGLLASSMQVVPDPTEQRTVLSLITGGLVGQGSAVFWIVQISTMAILTLAANTSFNGFPRLASILANDRFMPRQFAFRGDRLAYSTGIIVLAALSAMLLVRYEGSVTALIPLYTVGVFVAFTLSQTGLVRRWWRLRGRGWRTSIAINAVGAVATALVAVVVSATKFEQGAWLVVVVIPLIVTLLYATHRHYVSVEDALTITRPEEEVGVELHPLVLLPVGRLDRATLAALAFARQISGDVTALHVTDDLEEARHLQSRWRALVPDVPLLILESPYRALSAPLLKYIEAVDKGDRRRPIVVVLSEFAPRRWWEYILHNQTALRLKLALFFRPNTIVIDVPYHMSERNGSGRVS